MGKGGGRIKGKRERLAWKHVLRETDRREKCRAGASERAVNASLPPLRQNPSQAACPPHQTAPRPFPHQERRTRAVLSPPAANFKVYLASAKEKVTWQRPQ
jgi:hypothetical protein